MAKEFPHHVSIQIQCCSVLKELPLEGRAARYQVYCSGSMDAVISAMNRFGYIPYMQLCGCQFLSRMIICPVGIAILQDFLVRSILQLDTILHLLDFHENSSWTCNDCLGEVIRSAGKYLLCAVISQCPHEIRMELPGSIKQQMLESFGGNALALLEHFESFSVRDKQHVL
jgi:hypothetical protein